LSAGHLKRIMIAPRSNIKKTSMIVVALLLALTATTFAQDNQNPKPPQQEDVVRVYTDLVQTDVMVFNKEGRFVNGLKREDFDLKIDGKVRPIEFFERVTAGSGNEEAQLSAARGSSSSPNKANPIGPSPLDRGRTVFFYVDDFHLGPGSLAATRTLIAHFIEEDMGQNDEAAITSASGQIGFLQQLTDNKAVLRAALRRLAFRSYSVRDVERPPMTEYQALLIDQRNRDVIDYFVQEILRNYPGISREVAESMVRGRASAILNQASSVTTNTLIGLESLIRSSSKLPGRKLVFFISDGFLLNNGNSDSLGKLQRITSAAARSGVVIYSMDARGLVASLTDASTEIAFDPTGRLQSASHGELFASQDALNALARDTGGKPILNTNALEPGMARALQETSVYYLLAWKPERAVLDQGRFRRIEVRVIGKPELVIPVRRGFFDVQPAPVAGKDKEAKNQKPEQETPEAKLREAILAPYPDHGIPTSLNLNYIFVPDKGFMLSVSMQLATEFVSFSPQDGKQQAVVNVAGSIYNDAGQPGGHFSDQLKVTAPSTDASKDGAHDFVYTYPIFLKPGLYQVRVGAQDEKSGHVGSTQSWVEIPDLTSHQLALSSLIAGERTQPTLDNASATNITLSDQVRLSISRHFRRNSYLRFLVFVYNAARASDSKPDVALQIQMLRDGQPVITTALRKVSTEGARALERLPYAADVSLEGLPAGLYLLQVTAIDRVSRTSASQQMRFEIE
jgi:VWFA-related protein